MNSLKQILFIISCVAVTCIFCFAEEGMYLPHQIPPQAFQKMKELGFQLTQEDLFSTAKPSLAQAAFNFGEKRFVCFR